MHGVMQAQHGATLNTLPSILLKYCPSCHMQVFMCILYCWISAVMPIVLEAHSAIMRVTG